MIEIGFFTLDSTWYTASLKSTSEYRRIKLYTGIRTLTIF